MYDDDFEDFYMPDEEELRKKMEEKARQDFRKAAYRGYDMIVRRGMDAIEESEKENAILAIRRILGLMQEEEQFERCGFLTKFLKEELGAETTPMFDFNKK